MRKRGKRLGDGILVVIERNDRPKSVIRRILRRFGEGILWLLALAPGMLIIAHGVNGIRHQKLVHIGRYKGLSHGVSYGDDAVGWGWIFVALGFWALGQFCHLRTARAGFKWFGWALAVVAGGVGVWVLLRRFV